MKIIRYLFTALFLILFFDLALVIYLIVRTLGRHH
jgi:hypothetical protein